MSYQVGCKQILLIQVSVNFSISPLLKKNFISYYWSERNKTRSNAINKRQTSIKRVTKAPTISRHACVVFYVVLCSKILYPGASRFKTWRLNADRLLQMTELNAIFVMRKILKKLYSTVPVRELNFPTGHQSEHTGKHGCLQHEQIFLKKSEPLISMNRKIIHF